VNDKIKVLRVLSDKEMHERTTRMLGDVKYVKGLIAVDSSTEKIDEGFLCPAVRCHSSNKPTAVGSNF